MTMTGIPTIIAVIRLSFVLYCGCCLPSFRGMGPAGGCRTGRVGVCGGAVGGGLRNAPGWECEGAGVEGIAGLRGLLGRGMVVGRGV